MEKKRISTSKERLKEMMNTLKLSQADIVRRTGIPKGSLSLYLNGKRTPEQDQLSVIADPFGINPAWLMGYDLPMFLSEIQSFDTPADFELAWYNAGGGKHPLELTDDEYELILKARKLSESDENFYRRIFAYFKALSEVQNGKR